MRSRACFCDSRRHQPCIHAAAGQSVSASRNKRAGSGATVYLGLCRIHKVNDHSSIRSCLRDCASPGRIVCHRRYRQLRIDKINDLFNRSIGDIDLLLVFFHRDRVIRRQCQPGQFHLNRRNIIVIVPKLVICCGTVPFLVIAGRRQRRFCNRRERQVCAVHVGISGPDGNNPPEILRVMRKRHTRIIRRCIDYPTVRRRRLVRHVGFGRAEIDHVIVAGNRISPRKRRVDRKVCSRISRTVCR